MLDGTQAHHYASVLRDVREAAIDSNIPLPGSWRRDLRAMEALFKTLSRELDTPYLEYCFYVLTVSSTGEQTHGERRYGTETDMKAAVFEYIQNQLDTRGALLRPSTHIGALGTLHYADNHREVLVVEAHEEPEILPPPESEVWSCTVETYTPLPPRAFDNLDTKTIRFENRIVVEGSHDKMWAAAAKRLSLLVNTPNFDHLYSGPHFGNWMKLRHKDGCVYYITVRKEGL